MITDPRDLPNYSVAEAAMYLRVPPSTIRAWLIGQVGTRPVATIAARRPPALSFFNLVEAHILDAIRARRIPLQTIRRALAYVENELGVERPLINQVFQTDGVGLFVERFGKLIHVSGKGQLAMRAVLQSYLERIEFDAGRLAARLFPIADDLSRSDRRSVVFDPNVSFGRLCVAGTGIATDVLAGRRRAREPIEEIAHDFGLTEEQVRDAIAWERQAA